MPSADAILRGLIAVSNELRWLAFTWHLLLWSLLLALAAGWRPSRRLIGVLLALPFVSVSAAAWRAGNPFNGTVMTSLALALSLIATRFPTAPVGFASPGFAAAGALTLLFGSTYPHFLAASAWHDYVHSAPLGLVPCPTLSVAIGVTLLFGLFQSTAWTMVLTVAGLFYGLFGVAKLGVSLDMGLIGGATMLALAGSKPDDTTRLRVRLRNTRAFRFHDLPARLSKPTVAIGSDVVNRTPLLAIAAQAESHPAKSPRATVLEQERKRA